MVTEAFVRRDLQLDDLEGVDCLPNAIIFEQLTLIGDRKGFSGNITPLFSTMMVQAQKEVGEGYANLIDPITHLPLLNHQHLNPKRNKELGSLQGRSLSDEDRLTLTEPMELYTTLQQKVLALVKDKTTQALEIDSLKRRVGLSAKVVSYEDEGLGEEDASKQRRIADIDADAGISLDSTHFDDDTDMFGAHDLVGDEVIVDNVDVVKAPKETVKVAATTVSAATITEVDITLAQALVELKSEKSKATTALIKTDATTITADSTRPKAKGLVIHEQEQASTTIVSLSQAMAKDKGKSIMIEEPVKTKKKDQIRMDEEAALRLQAEIQAKLK
nr:hypothetical protein [Tanacetum cinerariifolium]